MLKGRKRVIKRGDSRRKKRDKFEFIGVKAAN